MGETWAQRNPGYIANYCRRRKAELKAVNLCQDCGNDEPKKGRTLCEACLQHRIDNQRERLARKAAEASNDRAQ